MFEFIKFYNRREVVSVGNIDHDQVVALIFETLTDIKGDPSWSFRVGHF